MGRRDDINESAMGMVATCLLGGILVAMFAPALGAVAVVFAAIMMLTFITNGTFR